MKRFEYKIEDVSSFKDLDKLKDYLNSEGEDGWELVNYELFFNYTDHYVVKNIIFKRKKN